MADDLAAHGGQRLEQVAEHLKAGEEAPKLRVRDFLSWFGAYRRGFNIVERIRQALMAAGLQTIPDFEDPHIDAEITFALLYQSEHDGDSDVPSHPQRRYLSDPIWRVRRLRSADKPMVSVAPSDSLEVAITKMLLHDFSQLPIISGRELKGAITWTSIGMRLAFGAANRQVNDFRVGAHVIDGNTPLLQAIPDIIRYQFVLVAGIDRQITGIITTSDLSEEFREQAEPFLLLREIEHQIRRFLIDVAQMSDEEIQQHCGRTRSSLPAEEGHPELGIHDLTFGDYVRIMENRDWWSRLNIPIDRAEAIKNLHRVREIRNSVMHFDPDTFDRDSTSESENTELSELRRMNVFFQRLLEVASPEQQRLGRGDRI